VFRGLDILATPSGAPLVGGPDGTRINGARQGRLRIVPNGVLGDGYRIEFDRTFGGDSRGRPEVLRLGSLAELQLDGATQWTAGYQTGGMLSGFSQFQIGNMNYAIRSKLGVQDAELNGTLNATANVELNQLGFYNLVLNVTNENSRLLLDGVVARTEDPTDFNVGPIVISGNIFIDGIAGLLSAAGVDTSFLEQLFPESPISQLDKDTTGKVDAALAESAETDEKRMAELLLATILGSDGEAGMALIEGVSQGELVGNGAPEEGLAVAPEPGTLVILSLGAGLLWCNRRRFRAA
jgi:hypothetical protein